MSAHVRACAACGIGPSMITGGGACCWNPVGCGCDSVTARLDLSGAESTSAALRRVEQERDELSATVDRMAGDHIRLLNRNIAAEAELASARTELDAVRAARDTLDRARSWIVARDDGYTCDWCGQGIHRGEAYDPTHGVDEYRHIHCPTEPKEGDTA